MGAAAPSAASIRGLRGAPRTVHAARVAAGGDVPFGLAPQAHAWRQPAAPAGPGPSSHAHQRLVRADINCNKVFWLRAAQPLPPCPPSASHGAHPLCFARLARESTAAVGQRATPGRGLLRALKGHREGQLAFDLEKQVGMASPLTLQQQDGRSNVLSTLRTCKAHRRQKFAAQQMRSSGVLTEGLGPEAALAIVRKAQGPALADCLDARVVHAQGSSDLQCP